jgi:hypothetical protein
VVLFNAPVFAVAGFAAGALWSDGPLLDSEEKDMRFVLCILLLVVRSGQASETSKGWSDWLSEGQSLSHKGNWQQVYAFTAPRTLPKGTRLDLNATFDNSPNNPNNPDPTATVKWGDQSWDEMALGVLVLQIRPDSDLDGLFEKEVQGPPQVASAKGLNPLPVEPPLGRANNPSSHGVPPQMLSLAERFHRHVAVAISTQRA